MNFLCKSDIDKYKVAAFIKRLFYVNSLFIFLFLPSSLQAHPHSWIDLKTTIVGDDKQITGFNMAWTFDTITSAYMLDGIKLTEENKISELKKIALPLMKNIANEHYFSYFYDQGEPIKYTFSEGGVLTQNKLKLTLNFFLPLSKPKPINGTSLKLLVFEPSYYVQMSWLKKQDITLTPDLAKRCSLDLVEPNPTSEQVAYAMSKPADDAPDNELGQLFTQQVFIKCSQSKD